MIRDAVTQMPKTIMIIDDDEDDRDLLCLAVRQVNKYSTIVCSKNGEEALAFLKSDDAAPDYIFLDLKMPRLTGKQTLARLRQMKKIAATTIIIYSITKSQAEEAEVKRMGAQHFLTRPYRFKDLVNSIACYFKRDGKSIPY